MKLCLDYASLYWEGAYFVCPSFSSLETKRLGRPLFTEIAGGVLPNLMTSPPKPTDSAGSSPAANPEIPTRNSPMIAMTCAVNRSRARRALLTLKRNPTETLLLQNPSIVEYESEDGNVESDLQLRWTRVLDDGPHQISSTYTEVKVLLWFGNTAATT